MNKLKIIKLYDGKYEIDNNGNIYSNISKRKKLKPWINNRGYYTVNFSVNKELIIKYVHTLLAELFIANPNNYKFITHLDGNKLNNNLTNLKWCEALKRTIKKNNIEVAEAVRKLYKTKRYTQKELGELSGLSQRQISRIVNNKIWKNK
jgi:hypothetical protein